jgi:hypothetical protein
MYPGNPLKLSIDDILNHYRNTGFKPTSKGTMNAAIREQYLTLREIHAFCKDLTDRGIIADDGALKALEESYTTVERHIQKLDSHRYT